MGRRRKRNVLLLEPNYKNKYPPIGLMKLATYHRRLGDNVVFYKGDLKQFILSEINEELIIKLNEIDNSVSWNNYKKLLVEFIKTGKKDYFEELISLSKYGTLIDSWLIHYKNYYKKKEYLKEPKWDRVCISTLFTFHWKITIETIEFAKTIVKNKKQIFVGGVLATVLADELEEETGIKPHKGLLNNPRDLDKTNDIIIDELPLDYSILDEIDYKYPENDAYYGYMTRGCIRKCSFCAVWKIEPKFNPYVSLKEKIEETKSQYGDQRNLLLLDNNVLASKQFPQIIEEIKESGFVKGVKFVEPNYLDIAVRNLKKGINDKAYIKKSFELFHYLLNKLKGTKQQEFYNLLDEAQLLKIDTATKENVLSIYSEIKEVFEKHRNKVSKLRYVDFNQGVDARLLTNEKMKLLSEIPIKPLRIAFDNIAYKEIYVKSVRLAAKYNIKNLSNYLLYNETDKPDELYERLEINILLSEELNISIYSFPMKFHPINGEKHLNRDFLGKHWNRKYIRAIQTVLNSTKGKIGKGESFFYKAFGKDLEEYHKILIMPETYILFRFFFEDMGFTEKWWNEYNNLPLKQREKALEIIKTNDFHNIESYTNNEEIINFLKEHYFIRREDINNPDSEIYKLKKEYDTHRKSHTHLQFAQAYTQPKIAKEYVLPTLTERVVEESTKT
jgi:hypothetical protein